MLSGKNQKLIRTSAYQYEDELQYENKFARRELRWTRVGLLLCATLLAVLVIIIVGWQSMMISEARMQEHLAQEVLRFHVLANSDSEEDQALKMKVKEKVIELLKEEIPEGMNVTETADWMRRNTDKLRNCAQQVVLENGYDYPISAAVTTCYFPEKTYGDVRFPAGNYEALRIEIGEAKGHNWWCVLYPGLCFLNTTNAVVPEEGKQKLRSVLTEDEYAQITSTTEFHIRWKLLPGLNK